MHVKTLITRIHRRTLTKAFNLFILLTIACSVNPSLSQDIIEWNVITHTPRSTDWHKGFNKHIVEPINEEFKGQFKIILDTHINAGSATSNVQKFKALQAGELSALFMTPQYWGDINPAFTVVGDLTAAWHTPDSFLGWLNQGGGRELLSQLYSKYDIHLIGYATSPHESIASTVPIRNIHDFKNKIMRVPPGSMTTDYFKEIGAHTRNIAFSNVRKSFKEGKMEMTDNSTLSANFKAGIYDIAKHTNYPGFHSIPLLDFIANKQAWEKLPQNVKNALSAQAKIWQKEYLKEQKLKNEKALSHVKVDNVKIYTWSKKDLNEARHIAFKVWDKYTTKSPETKDVITSIKTWIKKQP